MMSGQSLKRARQRLAPTETNLSSANGTAIETCCGATLPRNSRPSHQSPSGFGEILRDGEHHQGIDGVERLPAIGQAQVIQGKEKQVLQAVEYYWHAAPDQ